MKKRINIARRTEMRNEILIAALALMVLLSSSGFTQVASPVSESERDDILAADVERIIGNHSFYSVYDIVNVEVNNRILMLTGVVTVPYKKNSFVQAIRKKMGGSFNEIKNEIEVLPPSANDDRIRYLIARKIYNDVRLLRYSLSKWPFPIHIIVRNGHVELVGSVRNAMDKRLIESKVKDVNGLVSVHNNLEIVS
jgi:osmotically-inducible protein OsmY